MLAIAVIPGLTGLTGNAYRNPAVFASGFRTAMFIGAALAAAGGLLAWISIRNPAAAPGGPQGDRRQGGSAEGLSVATKRAEGRGQPDEKRSD